MSTTLYYPNRFVLSLFLAMEEVMGRHGLDEALELAQIDQTPPDDLDREFPFERIGALNAALDEMYGARGGRGMALRAGRAWFAQGMKSFGALTGIADPAFRRLPLEDRVESGAARAGGDFHPLQRSALVARNHPARLPISHRDQPLRMGACIPKNPFVTRWSACCKNAPAGRRMGATTPSAKPTASPPGTPPVSSSSTLRNQMLMTEKSAEKPHILIVEDDFDLLDMMEAYFRVQGYDVLTASWGRDGLKLSAEAALDLILLDIRLPDIDGYEVCRQLRLQRRTQDTPIIFLTEKRDRVDKLQGLELGVVDYITKPFDIQELRLRVRNTITRAAQMVMLNPVTELPEVAMLDERLTQALYTERSWALLLLSIGGLNTLRELYGFVAADEAAARHRADDAQRRDPVRRRGRFHRSLGRGGVRHFDDDRQRREHPPAHRDAPAPIAALFLPPARTRNGRS